VLNRRCGSAGANKPKHLALQYTVQLVKLSPSSSSSSYTQHKKRENLKYTNERQTENIQHYHSVHVHFIAAAISVSNKPVHKLGLSPKSNIMCY